MEICVVGGGFGGLAVAARLAAKRHRVILLERSESLGGHVQRITRDGFTFETGPTLLTLPAVYRDLFLKTGRALEDEVDLIEVEPGYHHVFPDGPSLRLPGGSSGRTAAAITEQFGKHSGREWTRITARGARMWEHSRVGLLQRPDQSRRLSLTQPDTARARTIVPWRSYGSIVRHHVSDPRLRKVLFRYATEIGSVPDESPSTLLTNSYVEQAFGLWSCRSGLSELRDALVRRCEAVGVDVRIGTEVVRINSDPDGVTGVRLADGSHVPAQAVVSDVDSGTLHRRLIEDERARESAAAVADLRLSHSAFTLFLGVRGRTNGLHAHTVFYPHRYRREFQDLRRGRRVRDPAIHIHRGDGGAPPGHESLVVRVSAPGHGNGPGQHDWSGEGQEYADLMLERLADRGLDLRTRIVHRSNRTPADVQLDVGSPGGSLHGTVSRGGLSRRHRPDNISPIPGLYLVGAGTHPGPGLPRVGMSAELVAEHIGRPG